jgi:hypothetical protein
VRELAILLDDGVVIRDSGWRCIADVMKSYHAFDCTLAYGVIVDAETLVQVYPKVTEASPTHRTAHPLG